MKRILINYVCIALMMTLLLALGLFLVDLVRFPEMYSSTWKYQLYNDLVRNDGMALDYYNSNYVENGRCLFGDEFIIK